MARKTVFRRLSKWLPMDAEVDDLMRRDDQAGAPTIEGVSEVAEPSAPMIEQDDFEMASSGVTLDQPAEDAKSAVLNTPVGDLNI
jgi:recombinational DNA repair protein RecT